MPLVVVLEYLVKALMVRVVDLSQVEHLQLVAVEVLAVHLAVIVHPLHLAKVEPMAGAGDMVPLLAQAQRDQVLFESFGLVIREHFHPLAWGHHEPLYRN